MADEFVLDMVGECVPVAATDKSGNVIDVFCQDCTKPMTLKEHKEYFDKYIPWFEKRFKKEYPKKEKLSRLQLNQI